MPKRYKVEAVVTFTDTETHTAETTEDVEEYDKEREARRVYERKSKAIKDDRDRP